MDWIRERRAALLALIGLVAAGLWWWDGRPLTHPAGELAVEDPVQTPPLSPEAWTFREHQITPLAHFEVRARILHRERYRFDRAAELSPVDFALGWGSMSDSRVLDALTIRQSDRWYFWSCDRFPIPREAIVAHSANMHLIPADASVERRLLRAKEGQVARLEGSLVRVDGKDGWHWISSLSRTDTGDGSCEVVWVDRADVSDR